MRRATQELRQELDKSWRLLETVLDEAEVKMHLAGMDARDAWRALRSDAKRVGREAGNTSRRAVDDVIDRVKSFKRSIQWPA